MFTNDFHLPLLVLKLLSCLCVRVVSTAENASKSERPDLTAARVVISGKENALTWNAISLFLRIYLLVTVDDMQNVHKMKSVKSDLVFLSLHYFSSLSF